MNSLTEPLPFSIKLTSVKDLPERLEFKEGEEYKVFEETRSGYLIYNDVISGMVEILFSECEKVKEENV